MEDYFDPDRAIAIVYLHLENDHKNMAMLSEDQLCIRYDGRNYLFAKNQIDHISTVQKRLLFPLIAGGIITPFATLSYFIHSFNPYFHLFATLAGIFLFYLGWTGKMAMVIYTRKKEESNFYVPAMSPQLQSFVDFANDYLKDSVDPKYHGYIYFLLGKDLTRQLFDVSSLSNQTLFPLFGYTFSQLRRTTISGRSFVAIDPATCGHEIKMVYDETSGLFRPRLQGAVPESCRIVIPESLFK